jgi:serine/threonine protein kinase
MSSGGLTSGSGAGARSPLVGQRIGDFEILEEIGRGGMGVVFRARQISLNRLVAFKILSDKLGLSDHAIARFRREAEATAKLHHANILPVYAQGCEEGTHYYAMELVSGRSLHDILMEMREPPAAVEDGSHAGVTSSRSSAGTPASSSSSSSAKLADPALAETELLHRGSRIGSSRSWAGRSGSVDASGDQLPGVNRRCFER